MYMSGGHGRCVEILHVMGDMLCQLGKPPLRPNLGPVDIDGVNDELASENQINENSDERLANATNNLEISCNNTLETEISTEVIYNIICTNELKLLLLKHF